MNEVFDLEIVKTTMEWEDISATMSETEKETYTQYFEEHLFFKIMEQRTRFAEMAENLENLQDDSDLDSDLDEDDSNSENDSESCDSFNSEINENEDNKSDQNDETSESFKQFLKVRWIIFNNDKLEVKKLINNLELEEEISDLKFLKELFSHSKLYRSYFLSDLEKKIKNWKKKKEWNKISEIIQKELPKKPFEVIELVKKYELQKKSKKLKISHFCKWAADNIQMADFKNKQKMFKFCFFVYENRKKYQLEENELFFIFQDFAKKNFERLMQIKFEEIKNFGANRILKFLLSISQGRREERLKKLLNTVGFSSQIGLLSMNKVNFSKDSNEIAQELRNLFGSCKDGKFTNFKEELLEILIGKIKRSEPLGDLISNLNNMMDLDPNLGIAHSKLLIDLFISNADTHAKLRFNRAIGKSISVPLVYMDMRYFMKYGETFYNFNYEVCKELRESTGVFTMSLGNFASLGFGAEKLLNRVFRTQFAEEPIFGEGSVDIDFGAHFLEDREVFFAHVYGRTQEEGVLEGLAGLKKMYSVVILQVSVHELKDIEPNKETLTLLKKIAQFSRKEEKEVMLIVRDGKEMKTLESLQEGTKKLEQVKKKYFHNFRVCIVDETEFRSENNEDPYYQKLIKKTLFDVLDSLPQKTLQNENSFFQKMVNFKGNPLVKSIEATKETLKPTEKRKKIDYLEKKRKQLSDFIITVNKTNEFLNYLEKMIDDEKFIQNYFFNDLYQEKRKILKELRGKENRAELENIKKLEENLRKLKERIKTVNPSHGIKKFYELLVGKDNSMVLLLLTERLKKLNKKSLKDVKQTKDNAVRKKEMLDPDNKQYEEIECEIERLESEIIRKTVSIEVLFRNIIPYIIVNKTWLNRTQSQFLSRKLMALLTEGFPIELIDGENLDFKVGFLRQISESIMNQDICPIACLGPQSSGKSTLLNIMFGTMFHTSQGRCTSGLYLSLQRYKAKDGETKWFLIIDTEGLQSSEKGDSEFDRKICTFILQNSKLILLTLVQEMRDKMKKDLQTTLYVLNQTRGFKQIPKIFFIFNRNKENDDSEESAAVFFKQIENINDKVLKAEMNLEKRKKMILYDVNKQNIVTLGNAFHTNNYEKRTGLKGENKDRGSQKIQLVNKYFNFIVGKLAKRLLGILDSENGYYTRLKMYLAQAFQSWDTIEKHSELVTLEDLEILGMRRRMKKILDILLEDYQIDLDKIMYEKELKYKKLIQKETEKEKINEQSDKKRDEYRIFLKQLWKKFEKKCTDDLTTKNQMNLKEFGNQSISMETENNIKIRTFLMKLENWKDMRILEMYETRGIRILDETAKDLKMNFLGSKKSDHQKKNETNEMFAQHFSKILEEFRNENDLKKLAENQRVFLNDFLKNYTMFYPKEVSSLPGFRQITVESCMELLEREINKVELPFSITKKSYMAVERDVRLRFMTERREFLEIDEVINVRVRLWYIKGIQKSFDLNGFLIRLYGVANDNTNSQKISWVKRYFSILEKHGVKIERKDMENLEELISKGEADMEKLAEILKKLKYNETATFQSIDNEVSQYFKLESTELEENQALKMIKSNQLNYHKKEYCLPEKYQTGDSQESEDLERFGRPWKCENYTLAVYSITNVLRKNLNFRKIIERIAQVCFKSVFEDNLAAGSRRQDLISENVNSSDEKRKQYINQGKVNKPEIIFKLMEKIYKQDIGELFNRINDELALGGAEMGDLLDGVLKFIAILFIWSFVMQATEYFYMKKYRNLESKRTKFFNDFIKIVENKEDSKAILEFQRAITKEMENKIWENHLENQEKKMQEHLETVRGKFDNIKITKKLAKRYLKNGSMNEGYEFARNQTRFLENEIDTMMTKHIDSKISDLDNEIKKVISREFERFRLVLKYIREFISPNGEKSRSSVVDLFRIINSQNREVNDISIKSQFSVKLAEFLFEIIYNINKGVNDVENRKILDSEYIAEFYLKKDRLNNIYQEIRESHEIHQLKQKNLSEDNFLCPILNKTLSEMKVKQIFAFNTFCEEGMKTLFDLKTQLKEKDLTIAELNLTKEIIDLKVKAKGCVERCRFCNAKCNHSGLGNHKHHAHILGHNPRVFGGAYFKKGGSEEKNPSMLVCQQTRGEKKILFEGREVVWEEIFEEEMPNWEIDTNCSSNDADTIFQYFEEYYKKHGKELCQKLGFSHLNMTIQEISDKFNKNSFTKKIHYIICLDDSGSMQLNDKWENIKRAYKEFIEGIQTREDADQFYISLIQYDDRAEIVDEFVKLSNYRIKDLVMKGENTDFGIMFRAVLKLFENNRNQVDATRILVYTDGLSEYPKDEMLKLKDIIQNQKEDLKLHWFYQKTEIDVEKDEGINLIELLITVGTLKISSNTKFLRKNYI